jgi:thermitase
MTLSASKRRRGSARLLALAVSCIAFACGALDAVANSGNDAAPQDLHVPGEVIVRFVADFPAHERAARLALLGGEDLVRIDRNGYGRVRLRAGETVAAAVARFASDPAIEHVQPNYRYRAQAVEPDDPLFAQQWALRNVGQTIESPSYVRNNPPPGAVRDISATAAWELITDCRDVTIAIVDTGINYTHEDLAANMWDGLPNHGYDFVGDDDDPLPATVREHHGTYLAGIIGAAGGNGRGISGVCPDASLMAVRVLDDDGVGNTADIVAGVEFALEHGAAVIVLSIAQPSADQALADAIQLAGDQDAIVVVAAGNSAREISAAAPSYPCSFTHANLVCVTALDQAYVLPDFANFGAAVDLGAPGTNIVTTAAGTDLGNALTDADAWTLGGRWYIDPNCDIAPAPVLANPENWCGPSPSYTPNPDERAWRTFALGPTIALEIEFSYWMQLALFDAFRVAVAPGAGDPFANGDVVFQRLGNQSGTAALDIDTCADSAQCTLGFQLVGNMPFPQFGVGVWNVRVRTLARGSNAYANGSGTSLAAAHAAGVAALVRAQSPAFTARDARRALIEGGRFTSALEFTTSSARALDARGALEWIDPPGAPVIEVQTSDP